MRKISETTKPADGGNSWAQGGQTPSRNRAAGAKAGAIAGSAGVGSLTLIIGLSSLLIPGVGLTLAVESLLITLFYSGLTATAGGLYGALRGWLAPEEHARIYSDRFDRDS